MRESKQEEEQGLGSEPTAALGGSAEDGSRDHSGFTKGPDPGRVLTGGAPETAASSSAEAGEGVHVCFCSIGETSLGSRPMYTAGRCLMGIIVRGDSTLRPYAVASLNALLT